MKKNLLAHVMCLLLLFTSTGAIAQIKIGDLPIDIDALLGKVKVLKVKKGFNPRFTLGDVQLNKVGLFGENLKGVKILGEVFSKKRIDQVNKLYKTYKTGLVVYKVLAGAGTALTAYTAVRELAQDKDEISEGASMKMLYPALASILTGVITKVVTKKASYKAVDIFNGIARKTVQDIFSVKPASSTLGLGLYVKL